MKLLGGVGHHQLGLHARQAVVGGGELGGDYPQLAGVGPVFGVVDDDQVALGQQQPGVAGPRLGLRLARRDLHDPDERRRVRGGDRLLGRGIPPLDQDQRLEPVLGVVEVLQAPHHAADHVLLLVGRDQDRVAGQLGVRDRRGMARGSGRRPAPPGGDRDHHVRGRDQGDRPGQDDRQHQRRDHQQRHTTQRRYHTAGSLPQRKAAVGGQVRGPPREVVCHVVRDHLAMLPKQAILLRRRSGGNRAQRTIRIRAAICAGLLGNRGNARCRNHFTLSIHVTSGDAHTWMMNSAG